jgi:mRNA interferase RelE/StbE
MSEARPQARVQAKEPQFSRNAAKYVSKLDKPSKDRIRNGIERIPEGDIVPLEGSGGSFRLRIGSWRVIFSWVSDDQILIEKIGSRGDIYKGAK